MSVICPSCPPPLLSESGGGVVRHGGIRGRRLPRARLCRDEMRQAGVKRSSKEAGRGAGGARAGQRPVAGDKGKAKGKEDPETRLRRDDGK